MQTMSRTHFWDYPDNYRRYTKVAHYVTISFRHSLKEYIDRHTGKAISPTASYPFIVSNRLGEMYCIDWPSLVKWYRFSDGTPFTKEEIQSVIQMQGERMCVHGIALPGIVRWGLRVSSDREFGILCGSDYKVVNQQGINHGYGDVILCKDNGGRPDLREKQIVNGLVFDALYVPCAKEEVVAGE